MSHVLHVIPYLDPTAGGPPVVVERLCELASLHGDVATVLTTAAYTSDGGAALRRQGGGVIVLDSQRSALSGAGRRAMIDAVSHADILHLHTLWSPLVAVAAAEARRRNTPYILSPHGMLDPYSLGRKAWKKQIYLKAVERRTLSGADRILFTTEAERDLALGEMGALPPPAVIPLGADAPPAPRETLAAEFRAAHPDLDGRPLLIFLGRVDGKKRPEAAVGAMPAIRRHAPAATLLLVGTGEPAIRRALETQVQQLGLGDAVRFLGHLSGRAKWQALAASSVFVLPSRQENFAIAAAEALHAGVPVLLTERVNIWRDIVEAGAGFAVSETAAEVDLADRAVPLLLDRAQHARCSQAASDLAARAYTWEACAASIHQLYEQVLSAHPPNRRLTEPLTR